MRLARVWGVAGAVWAGVLAGPAGAAAPGTGIDIVEAVRSTLALNPSVRLAVQSVEAARGGHLVDSAIFDLQLSSNGSARRTHTTDAVGAEALQRQYAYSLGASRLFRNGVSLQQSLSLSRTGLSTQPGAAALNTSSVGLTASVPLLRDRAGVSSAAAERAALLDLESSRLSLRHTTARVVLSAVTAYWDYLSAQRRLEVFRGSEERARSTVEQTRALVQAEERTPADLTQVLGNLASKKATRISAEQGVVDARQQLGLAMGLPAEAIPSLPAAATDFPEPRGDVSPDAVLIARALAGRADLLAAENDLRAAEALLQGAKSDLRPRLDLTAGTGYTAVDGGLGWGNFVGPLFRESPKLDASLALSFQFPTANSRARGRLLASSAAHEQQRILREDLARSIESAVSVAVQALRRASEGTLESAEAARLSASTVQAEQRKFELGVSTLFDVIQAQDGLTSALLSDIQSRRNYAVAVSTLRFQAGLLVQGEPEAPAVDGPSLLTPP